MLTPSDWKTSSSRITIRELVVLPVPKGRLLCYSRGCVISSCGVCYLIRQGVLPYRTGCVILFHRVLSLPGGCYLVRGGVGDTLNAVRYCRPKLLFGVGVGRNPFVRYCRPKLPFGVRVGRNPMRYCVLTVEDARWHAPTTNFQADFLSNEVSASKIPGHCCSRRGGYPSRPDPRAVTCPALPCLALFFGSMGSGNNALRGLCCLACNLSCVHPRPRFGERGLGKACGGRGGVVMRALYGILQGFSQEAVASECHRTLLGPRTNVEP